jgi:hypothetical protein
MSPKKQCGSCYWFESQPGSTAGICFYNPPAPLPLMAQSAIARPGQPPQQPNVAGIRPPTESGARCHKWSANGVEPLQ